MSVFRVKSEEDINSRRMAMQRKLFRQHEVMRECQLWHNLEIEALTPAVWRNVVENTKRYTEISAVPRAVKTTCVAFTTSKQPKIRAVPLNTLSAPELSAANFTERIGYVIWHTINRHRQQKLDSETANYGYGWAVMIAKACWLTPEQRGDERVAEPVPMLDIPFQEEVGYEAPEELTKYTTTKQGDFPILVQLYDPLDCLWTVGKGGNTREFMHISRMSWDEVVDLYPDIFEKEKFRERTSVASMDQVTEIIDYWDQTHNAILVDGEFYKRPTEHGYTYCPIIIELVNVEQVGISSGPGEERQKVATPITW